MLDGSTRALDDGGSSTAGPSPPSGTNQQGQPEREPLRERRSLIRVPRAVRIDGRRCADRDGAEGAPRGAGAGGRARLSAGSWSPRPPRRAAPGAGSAPPAAAARGAQFAPDSAAGRRGAGAEARWGERGLCRQARSELRRTAAQGGKTEKVAGQDWPRRRRPAAARSAGSREARSRAPRPW